MLHQHGFDFFAVAQPKETFRGLLVPRPLQSDGLERGERDGAGRERRAQFLGKRRYIGGGAEQLFGCGTVELAQAVRFKLVSANELLDVGEACARYDVAQPNLIRAQKD